MAKRYRAASASFKAGFKAFRIGGGGGRSEEESSEWIKARCDEKDNRFSEHIKNYYSESIGSALATQIVECVRILSAQNQEALFGTVRVANDDKGFLLDIWHTQGRPAIKYMIQRIELQPNAVKCTVGNGDERKDPVGEIISGENALSCEKEPGQPAMGSIVLQPHIGDTTRAIRVNVPSLNAEREQAAEIERRVGLVRDQVMGDLSALRGTINALRERLGQRKIAIDYGACEFRTNLAHDEDLGDSGQVLQRNIDSREQCPDNMVLIGVAGGRGHSGTWNSPHGLKCCRMRIVE